MSNADADIFISHASQDRRIAGTLCSALEHRGFHCWMAHRDVAPGENFQAAIVRAIRRARIMLLVFTNSANNSDEIKKELALASQNKLVVIPLRVEDVIPEDAFAFELVTRQWVDMFEDWELALERLVARIKTVVPAAPFDERQTVAALPAKEAKGRAASRSESPGQSEAAQRAPVIAKQHPFRRVRLTLGTLCALAVSFMVYLFVLHPYGAPDSPKPALGTQPAPIIDARRMDPPLASKQTDDGKAAAAAKQEADRQAALAAKQEADRQAAAVAKQEVDRQAALRATWDQWQGRMQLDFQKTAAVQGTLPAQRDAWEAFLRNWDQKNPYTDKDQELRTDATRRIAVLQNLIAAVPPTQKATSGGNTVQCLLPSGTQIALPRVQCRNQSGLILD